MYTLPNFSPLKMKNTIQLRVMDISNPTIAVVQNVGPTFSQVRCPHIAVIGHRDPSVSAENGADSVISNADRGGNDFVCIVRFLRYCLNCTKECLVACMSMNSHFEKMTLVTY